MKNVKIFFSAFVLSALSLSLIHCSKGTTGFGSPTEEALVKNIWSVDYYFYNQDMTNSYNNSRLLFSSTGAVGYQINGETIAGTWNRTVDASNNELITLQFNTSDANIEGLNKSWKLTDRTAISIQFEEIDGTTNILFRLKTE
ncbi:MAG: hypothetical protein ACHQF0_11255 [Chitinophagales bacterium]